VGIVDFIALVFAASGWVDSWFNGSIFAEFRAYFETRDDSAGSYDTAPASSYSATDPWPSPPRPLWMRAFDLLPNWFCELVTCRFCFSHHTPWLLAFGLLLPALMVPDPWNFVLKIPVYSLAATRIGNIINACLPNDARYDRGVEAFTYEESDGPTTPTT